MKRTLPSFNHKGEPLGEKTCECTGQWGDHGPMVWSDVETGDQYSMIKPRWSKKYLFVLEATA